MSSEDPNAAQKKDQQFEIGHKPAVQHDNYPGLEENMDPHPLDSYLPTPEGGKELYKAAGKLKGRNAIITGGDSGIGRATAVLYAMEGVSNILITYLPEQEETDAKETKKMCEHYGAKVVTLGIDLRKKENCKKTIDTALKEFKKVNILVLNHATQMVRENIEELPEEQWELTFDTNIHPFFYLSKYLIPHLTKGDTIITNASVNAYVGRPDLLDYTSTKGAIVSFTRGLSNQYCGKGIRVNAVAPGPVWTPLVTTTMGTPQQQSFTSPIGRPSQPSEIATCFVFLASPDSSSISGQTIHANGGVIVNG
ncbi:enoyl-(acyl carrier protein) reductase-like protein 4 [Elsinoe australis]|uniref:Enoyl-(Acyl carrier protein) reductase-like protein 4 n=1 Tax=Elsinoe australis TaxID=40998 RepID=A0A2P7YCE8_9PEZI|nr:Levodione reductase [Elsinoe australis]TKX21351.1 enoyl-(acyl carrier protein) reductase-like protein 4 [Elsinoe australis]